MTITFVCPGCNKRFQFSETYAGKNGSCKRCGIRFTVPALVPPPTTNPFEPQPVVQPPAQSGPAASALNHDVAEESTAAPATLIILIVLVGLHILLDIGIFFLGLTTDNPLALIGGLVSFGFDIAILIGLIKMQEWARILIIWLSYVGIVASLGLFSPLEIPTLIFAHWPSTRKATRGVSMAKSYTYHENQDGKEESTNDGPD